MPRSVTSAKLAAARSTVADDPAVALRHLLAAWRIAVVTSVPGLPPLSSARVVVATRTADLFATKVRERLIAAFVARGDVALEIG